MRAMRQILDIGFSLLGEFPADVNGECHERADKHVASDEASDEFDQHDVSLLLHNEVGASDAAREGDEEHVLSDEAEAEKCEAGDSDAKACGLGDGENDVRVFGVLAHCDLLNVRYIDIISKSETMLTRKFALLGLLPTAVAVSRRSHQLHGPRRPNQAHARQRHLP